MNSSLIVANLKSFLTFESAKNWLESFRNSYKSRENVKVILCPPFLFLDVFKEFINNNNLEIFLGSQDISAFGEGPYTGEINAKQLKDFVSYALIGHSERRSNLGEDDTLINKKIQQALSNNISPLYIVQKNDQDIPEGVNLVVYEPPGSISNVSGNKPDDIKDVERAAQTIKEEGNYNVLYGGSVNSSNVSDFTKSQQLSGVVVGGASLEAEEFAKIIQNA
jgi:triosephosphate isomerase